MLKLRKINHSNTTIVKNAISNKMSVKNQQTRVNFASVKKQMPFPDFLDIQLKSFHEFFQMDSSPEQRRNEGLYKVFSENFPISDARNNFSLEFLDYYIDRPRYTIQETLKNYPLHPI